MHQQGEQTPVTPHSQLERFQHGGNWIDNVEMILKKPCQGRSHAQHSFVLKSLLNIKYFQELAKVSDPQIIKHIVKYTKIVRLPKRYKVIELGAPIDHYFVILKGRVGVEKEKCTQQLRNKNKIQNMIKIFIDELAESEHKAPKRRSKKNQEQVEAPPLTRHYTLHQIAISQLQFCDQMGEQESIGDQLHEFHGHRRYNAVTMQETILLELQFSSILKAIRFYNEKQLDSKHSFFRKFRCFDLFQDEQLKALITHCKKLQRTKNDYIFKEGDIANQFYLLEQGEVCITKVAKLFVENPNKLYANRKAYMKNRMAQALPYANLEKLYNYRPKEERIELGLVAKDNLFGEEQAFLRTPRQTSARICTPTASFYVIQLADIEVALKQKKYMPQDFRDFLFANITKKKILYRQDKFSEVLNLKNRSQLDYFFIEKNEQEDKQSPLKYKLQKINNKITQLTPKVSKSKQPEEKATYDTFNFTKMITMRDSIVSLDDPETKEEKDMVDRTHATQFIEKQLHSEMLLSRMRNPVKRSINLNDPLFERDYFVELAKKYQKIEKQYKKARFSFKNTETKSKSLNSRVK